MFREVLRVLSGRADSEDERSLRLNRQARSEHEHGTSPGNEGNICRMDARIYHRTTVNNYKLDTFCIESERGANSGQPVTQDKFIIDTLLHLLQVANANQAIGRLI